MLEDYVQAVEAAIACELAGLVWAIARQAPIMPG
jgi:hypothetical protein